MVRTLVVALLLASGVASAQEEKKKAGGPLGLPASAALKESCGLDDEQAKKVDELYASYKEKAVEAMKKAKEAADKKAARKDLETLRGEIAAKLGEIGKDEEQKKKIGEAVAKPAKKKKDANP